MHIRIHVRSAPAEPDRQRLREAFRRYELSMFPALPAESEDQPVAAYAFGEDDAFVGGAHANVYWDGVEI